MRTLGLIILVIVLGGTYNKATAHCEIPCGIYGDSVRIALIYEHIATIEKSIDQIRELSSKDPVDYNQLVRWVMNKEEHAVKIQDIAAKYFLHQRIKIIDPSDTEAYGEYIKQLTLMHKIQVYAMKLKQGTEVGLLSVIRDTVHEFEHAYFGKH